MRNQNHSAPKKLAAEQRRALKMLADASMRGCAEAVLRVYGFEAATLAELVNSGLASRLPEQVQAVARSVEVARLWITPAGREAIQ
jgi:hypothetical protein